MRPHRLAFVLSLAAGLALAGSDVPRHQLTPSPEGNLVVGLCDGETSIEVKGVKPGNQLTREQGQQIAGALMQEWRQKHPDAEWVVAAADGAPEAPGAGAPAESQFQTYGAFTGRDRRIWQEFDRTLGRGRQTHFSRRQGAWRHQCHILRHVPS